MEEEFKVGITIDDMAKLLGMSVDELRDLTKRLAEHGFMERTDFDGTGGWQLSERGWNAAKAFMGEN